MIKAIIFDLDGTLIDSRKANVSRYNHLATMLGFPKARTKKEQDYINTATTKQVIHHFAPSMKLESQAIESIEGKLPGFIRMITLQPGAITVLKKLHKKFTLALVTNRGTSTQPLLMHFGIFQFFSVIITADDVKNPKPHPEPLNKAVQRLQLKKQECIYVGDMKVDYIAAVHSHIQPVLLNNGCHGPYHIHQLGDLPRVVKKIESEHRKRTR